MSGFLGALASNPAIANISTRVITGVAGGLAAAATDAISLYSERDNFIVQNQNVTFPEDLKGNAYIHMRFERYSRRSINQQPFFEPQNSIRLALPKELNDTVGVQYSTEELGSLIGAAAETVTNVGNLNFSFDSIQNVISSGLGVSGAVGITAAQGAASLIPGNLGNRALSGLSALTGITPNPYQTVLFKSPNFKKHRFSWRLVPKTKEESNKIEFIIRLFKYHMLPGISAAGGLFFSYPEILKIKLFPKDEYLYKFKPCVIESVSVNYAPNGLSFYRETAAPTAIDFSISLQEIEIWTKADYIRDANGRPTPNTAPNLRAGIE